MNMEIKTSNVFGTSDYIIMSGDKEVALVKITT